MTSLVRSGPPRDDDIDGLRSRIAELEAVLGQRVADIVQRKSSLEAFRIRYRQEVGFLHEELDELEQAIAEAELGEFARRLEDEAGGAPPPATPGEAGPRYTSDAVRRLFRDVAKTIHPDLARDEFTRRRRHSLMVEANRAYALGDEDRLRSILAAWEKSPDAVDDRDPAAARERLVRRIAEIEDQLIARDRELTELTESPLWTLKVMVDDAAGRGKDLVADMVRRLKRDIIASRNRLDAMRWRP